jgi:hypothetical protein
MIAKRNGMCWVVESESPAGSGKRREMERLWSCFRFGKGKTAISASQAHSDLLLRFNALHLPINIRP